MAGSQADILDNEIEATYQGRQHKKRQRLDLTITEHRHTSFYCTLLYCILQILRFDFFFALFFTNWRFVATLSWASLPVPFFQLHLPTSCLCVTFWQFSQYSEVCHYFSTCNGDLWSVTFDVTIAKWLWLTEGSEDGYLFFSNKVLRYAGWLRH